MKSIAHVTTSSATDVLQTNMFLLYNTQGDPKRTESFKTNNK